MYFVDFKLIILFFLFLTCFEYLKSTESSEYEVNLAFIHVREIPKAVSQTLEDYQKEIVTLFNEFYRCPILNRDETYESLKSIERCTFKQYGKEGLESLLDKIQAPSGRNIKKLIDFYEIFAKIKKQLTAKA